MPAYDYICTKTDKKTERTHPMSQVGADHYCNCGSVLRQAVSKPMGIHGANTGERSGT